MLFLNYFSGHLARINTGYNTIAISFQEVQRWEDGSPLSFTQYENTLYGENTYLIYESGFRSNVYLPVAIPLQQSRYLSEYLPWIVWKMIYPQVHNETRCSLLMFSNLAEPEWINIHCNKKIVSDVFCFVSTQNHTGPKIAENFPNIGDELCFNGDISKGDFCYLFHWLTDADVRDYSHNCSALGSVTADIKTSESLQFLSKTISTPFPQILFDDASGSVAKLRVEKHLNLFHFGIEKMNKSGGLFVCQKSKAKVSMPRNTLQCLGVGYISQVHSCNNHSSCSVNNRGMVCHCGEVSEQQKISPANLRGNKKEPCLTDLHFLNIQGECEKYVLESSSDAANFMTVEKDSYVCNNTKKIFSALVDDLVADCSPEADDEMQLLTLLTGGNFDQDCKTLDQVPCKTGHCKGFNFTQICEYQLDSLNHLCPCRTGAHVSSCHDFECTVNFKCPESYCVPWCYVCDGKWDCSTGKEEGQLLCISGSRCLHMYKCWKTGNMCVPLSNV